MKLARILNDDMGSESNGVNTSKFSQKCPMLYDNIEIRALTDELPVEPRVMTEGHLQISFRDAFKSTVKP
jgi:hypothetical protein